MNQIKVTKFYWKQPGAIRYDYRETDTGALVNVERYSSGLVHLWTINAWGGVYEYSVSRESFNEKYRLHNKPSMYEQMDAIKREIDK